MFTHTFPMDHFCVLGSHPQLSEAEYRAVYPKDDTRRAEGALLIHARTWDGAARMTRLGGAVKLGDVIASVPVSSLTAHALADLIAAHPRGTRIIFGLSVYGSKRTTAERLGKELKRELKRRGRAARWITSKGDAPLSPAAVVKMNLTSGGYDVVVIIVHDIAHVGFTTHVQDADAWSRRDYGRPARSAKHGMLPPKLARMMVNLADIPNGGALLDPFCGSGTILMEAGLATRAKKIIGSDIDGRQVADSMQNIAWLTQEKILDPGSASGMELLLSDVRDLTMTHIGPVDAIVTEGHLGPPLKGGESQAVLQQNADRITALWRDALPVLHRLLKKRGRLVCIWPSFQTKHGSAAVDLSENAFVQTHFSISQTSPLPYRRPGQFVTRNIYRLAKRD